MFYIVVDKDDLIISADEYQIDPVATKKEAIKKISNNKEFQDLMLEYQNTVYLQNKSKNKNRYNKNIKHLKSEIDKIIQSYINNNKVYINPAPMNGKAIKIDRISIDEYNEMVKKCPVNYSVKYNGSFEYIPNFVGVKFWRKINDEWTSVIVKEIGAEPQDGWTRHGELTKQELSEISKQNETDEVKKKKKQKEAFSKFLDRLFKESPEYKELTNE